MLRNFSSLPSQTQQLGFLIKKHRIDTREFYLVISFGSQPLVESVNLEACYFFERFHLASGPNRQVQFEFYTMAPRIPAQRTAANLKDHQDVPATLRDPIHEPPMRNAARLLMDKSSASLCCMPHLNQLVAARIDRNVLKRNGCDDDALCLRG